MEVFFRGIWEDVKQSSAENIESNIKKAWQKQDKKFYVECIKKAYDLGEKEHKVLQNKFYKMIYCHQKTALA